MPIISKNMISSIPSYREIRDRPKSVSTSTVLLKRYLSSHRIRLFDKRAPNPSFKGYCCDCRPGFNEQERYVRFKIYRQSPIYLSLSALHLSGTPSLQTGTRPPSCFHLDNSLYMLSLRSLIF